MRLRRALSVFAAAFTLAAQFSPAVSADMLDGETTRSFRSLDGGAGAAEYVLGAASGYGVQEFSAVTFDCAHDDLRFDVLPCDAQSGASFADTVRAFCHDSSRRVIAALSVPVTSGTAGGVQVDDRTESARGYTVCGGTMIRSGPVSGDVCAESAGGDETAGISVGSGISSAPPCTFGTAANGSAMIGEITLNIEIRNRRTGETILSDALNRPPQEDRVALFTDIAAADLPDGICALAVDVMPGCSLTPGAPVEGTVIGTLRPGGSYVTNSDPESANGGVISTSTVTGAATNDPNTVPNVASAGSSRVFIAARGDGSGFSGFEDGDRITLTADISDASGKTALWRTAASAVSGRALVRHGEKVCFSASSPQSAAVIGLRPDGSAMMLASYGAQKGYSLGFTPGDLADICLTLGMTDALVIGTGENTVMLCESEDGSLVPTGKNSGKGCNGAIVISVPAPETSSSAGAAYPDETCAVAEYTDHSPAVLAAKGAGYNAALADGSDLFRRMSSAAVPNSAAQCRETAPPRTGAFLPAKAADEDDSVCSLYKQLEFEATGEWITLVIKESDLDAWYGKIYGLSV